MVYPKCEHMMVITVLPDLQYDLKCKGLAQLKLKPVNINNVCFKKTWTNYSTVSLLWFVQFFLKQTLVTKSQVVTKFNVTKSRLHCNKGLENVYYEDY